MICRLLRRSSTGSSWATGLPEAWARIRGVQIIRAGLENANIQALIAMVAGNARGNGGFTLPRGGRAEKQCRAGSGIGFSVSRHRRRGLPLNTRLRLYAFSECMFNIGDLADGVSDFGQFGVHGAAR